MTMIYNPLEEYESKFKAQHAEKTSELFSKLVEQSNVNVEENRLTVKKYHELRENLAKLKKKLNLWRFLRVLAIITLILIPLVILKMTPKIRAMRAEIEEADRKADELLAEAERQMAPLIALFRERHCLDLIEEVIPLVKFAPCFSAEQEENMRQNFDFDDFGDVNSSTIDVLAGSYNDNPFIFETRLTHVLGIEVYHGYKTIHWTERYRGSDGKMHTRTRTQTLHATVTKPKPFYSTEVLLKYCAQGGPELSFTRSATDLDDLSEKQIDKHIKKGEKKLKKLTDEAIEENKDFVSMSNSDFEVLFGALNRTNEVQFRTLFTPLAQTNMVDLILSETSYEDDFNFTKRGRTNTIRTRHSQGRALMLYPALFRSYSFDVIKENFEKKNADFFREVYFDFAPLLAIPMYQERPVHSLDPLPDYSQLYSYMECEALANATSPKNFVHPATKTKAILKSSFVGSRDGADEINVSAYSYDIEKRVDFVTMLGGDGRMHSVAVPWDEYIPLEASNNFFVATVDKAKSENVIGAKGSLFIYN